MSGTTKDKMRYEYRIELLKIDRDALKQEFHLAGGGTQSPTHLSEKIQR